MSARLQPISIRGESYRLKDKRKARVFHAEEVKGDPSYLGNSNLMILGKVNLLLTPCGRRWRLCLS
jgi:hypothetical protein